MAGLDLNQLAFLANQAGKARNAATGDSVLGRALSGLGFATGLGQNFGSSGVQNVAGNLGQAAGLAGLGYGIYNTATNDNLSTAQKAGGAALQASDYAQLLIPYYGAFYGAGLAADALGNAMQKSGSPQIRAGGRQITAPLLPVEGFRRVISGQQSPRASFNQMVDQIKQVPVLGHPAGEFLKAFGIGTEPTHGTKFRNDMGAVAGQIPELKGFNINNGGFAKFMDPKQYDAYSLDDRMAAMRLANYMAPASPQYNNQQRGPAYSGQLQRALLGQYGDKLSDIESQVQARLREQAQQAGAHQLVNQAHGILAGMGAN